MRQRRFKLSLGIKIISILSCVALISVGFAAWWIMKPVDPVNLENQGSFEVYGVAIKEVKIENATVNNSNIIFGYALPAQDQALEYDWLGWDETKVQAQNLKATLSFDLNTAHAEDTINALVQDVIVTLTISEANLAKLQAAVDAKYIASLPTLKCGDTSAEYANGVYTLTLSAESFTTNTQSLSVDFEFAWGETFGGTNPYLYYNGMSYSAKIGEADAWSHANENLTGLSATLTNDITYNVVISATAKTAGN